APREDRRPVRRPAFRAPDLDVRPVHHHAHIVPLPLVGVRVVVGLQRHRACRGNLLQERVAREEDNAQVARRAGLEPEVEVHPRPTDHPVQCPSYETPTEPCAAPGDPASSQWSSRETELGLAFMVSCGGIAGSIWALSKSYGPPGETKTRNREELRIDVAELS